MLPLDLSNAITYLSSTNMLWLQNISLPGLFVLRGCLLIMNVAFALWLGYIRRFDSIFVWNFRFTLRQELRVGFFDFGGSISSNSLASPFLRQSQDSWKGLRDARLTSLIPLRCIVNMVRGFRWQKVLVFIWVSIIRTLNFSFGRNVADNTRDWTNVITQKDTRENPC